MVKVGEIFVEGCDSLLKQHPKTGIGVIGTGGRGIYSVLRRLVLALPDRGDHRRIKLLDVSTKLLFGPEKHAVYAFRSSTGELKLLDKDAKPEDVQRAGKLLSYMEKLRLLDHPEILLIDTGFNGTVIRNLKEIILRRFPRKKVKLMLLYPNQQTHGEIEALPLSMDWENTRKLTRLLEAKSLDVPSSIRRPSSTTPAGVHVAFEFERWGGAWRPKYLPSNQESKETAKAKHQKLAEAVQSYLKRTHSAT